MNAPLPSPAVAPSAEPADSREPRDALDAREAGRVVAAVLLSAGEPGPDLWKRANEGLQKLGRAPIDARDRVLSTPEEIGPKIPVDLRQGLAALLVALSEDEPLRRRVARSFIDLWQLPPPEPAPPRKPPSAAERVARFLIGKLPRHQDPTVDQERPMLDSVYRRIEPEPEVAPPVRDPLRLRVERIRKEYLAVVEAVERVVIGKRDVIERALAAMAARGHVLLMDVPGVGKTQLCKAIAAAVGVRFGRVQLTPDLLPMDLTGATIYEADSKQFVFRPGPVFTNILLADEINRATPKTQSALLEVMEERTVTVDGQTHRMAEPFQVLATMNPLDHEGTFALPAAQIDRFMVLLELGYPSPEDEVRVLDTHLAPDPALSFVRPVIDAESLLDWQRTVPQIHASPEVKRAAVDLINVLRRDTTMGHSISPRATLAWMKAAQARAMLAGREFVTVEDLLDIAPDVLRHRLWIPAAEVKERLRAARVRALGAGR
ncbi:MAG: AAA family ATPase [Byssovorax sp.]